MVANPAIASEGFKSVTVKFLSKSAEPQMHSFEYEQGMLFVRFPKWIQEKLKSLKKTLDFSALPLVKVQKATSIVVLQSDNIFSDFTKSPDNRSSRTLAAWQSRLCSSD